MLTDYASIDFYESAQNLYGTRSIVSLNCTAGDSGEGDTLNVAFGNDGHDFLIGGGFALDYLDGGSGDDIAAGDCVFAYFHEDSYLLAGITSIHSDVGKGDELVMGAGNDIAIGGFANDRIFGDDGMDILFGDSVAMTFSNALGSDNVTMNRPWGAPLDLNTSSCEHGGEDWISGGAGAVDYM